MLGPATNALPIIATGFPSEADDSSAVTTIEDLLYQNKPTNQGVAIKYIAGPPNKLCVFHGSDSDNIQARRALEIV